LQIDFHVCYNQQLFLKYHHYHCQTTAEEVQVTQINSLLAKN